MCKSVLGGILVDVTRHCTRQLMDDDAVEMLGLTSHHHHDDHGVALRGAHAMKKMWMSVFRDILPRVALDLLDSLIDHLGTLRRSMNRADVDEAARKGCREAAEVLRLLVLPLQGIAHAYMNSDAVTRVQRPDLAERVHKAAIALHRASETSPPLLTAVDCAT